MTLGKRAGSEPSCRTGRRQGSGRWVMALLLTVLGIGVVFLSAPAPAVAPVSSWPDLAEGNTAPVALWSDGDILWVADFWEQYVYAYDLAAGDRVPASDIDVEGLYPSGLWGDEETLWVLNYTGGLFAYSLATGAPDEPADIASVGSGVGLWSDGETLWVTDCCANATRTLKAYDFSGQRLPEEDLTTLSAAGNRSPIGMWSDGETVWVADSEDAKLYAYDLATAERVPAWDLDTLEPGNNAPMGVWSDGETVWVADFDAATVHAYVLPGVEADAHAGSVSEGNEDLPDGRLATPGVVVVGDSVTGTIDPAGDRDAYAVELEAGTTYQIDLEGAATGQGTLADPSLRWLRDATGSGIPGTRDDNGGEGLNARQVFTPAESGTYYISARAIGNGTGTYLLSVMVQPAADPPLSSDARLGTLQLSGINMGAFNSYVTHYAVGVPHSVAETTVSATVADSGASLSIDPATDADPEADGHQVALAAGATTVITITVTAADGTERVTTVRIARMAPPSNDARLGTLQLSGITLDAFSSAVTDYSVSVAHSVAETTVSATAADAGASLSIDPATDADSEADGHQVALAAGATTVITITVTAADGSVQATTVRVTRAASNDARLGTLELSGIALDAFSSDVTDYSVSVAHSVAETTVSATAADAGASLSIDPATDADSEADGHQVALAAGATTVITITVTAADGSVQATTVRISRAASSDARLGTLQLSGITLDAFSSDVTDYSVSVAHSVAETTVSATAADAGASLSIDPATDADSEADGHQVALAAGATTVITITVTAADGSVQATTVRISRAASSDARLGTLQLSGITLDAFSSDVTDYSVSVAHSVAETTVSATVADAGASLSIDPATDADSEASGHQVALAAGATTVITLTVTAADGSVQATTVRIARAASNDARLGTLQLSGIALDVFSSDVTDYSVSVAHSVAETTVSATAADAGASLSIDPATDADGEASGHQVALAAGATTVITITVTAADGSVQATTVRISRAAPPSSDARLGTLELSGIALDAFSSDVTDYSVSVAYSVAETTVSATVANSGASLSIDPATDADAEVDGHQVALAAGATTVITLTVTAADGSVQATTVRISRAASNDARLGTLELSGITLDGFSGEVTDYSVSVAHSVAETTISTAVADSGASLSIDPATDADPDADGHQVALSAGATTVITITVTAADGSVRATTVRITRAASSDARLGTLELSGIALDGFSGNVTDYSATATRTATTVSATAADSGASVSIDPADAHLQETGHQVALAAGETTVITVTVTAADGAVQATTVRITRAVADALPAEMTRHSLLNSLRDQQISSVEDFVAALPVLHKRHVAFVYRSEALFKEFISGAYPRVISWGADGRFVFSWSTDPASPGHEFVEFLKPEQDRWIAGVIDFSGSTPTLREPAACASCHGQLHKPLWGGIWEWLGTEGEGANTAYPASPEIIANTLQVVESTDRRIAPLELRPYSRFGGIREIPFPNGKWMPVTREIGAVFTWRHDEVLFGEVRGRATYAEIARGVVCAGRNGYGRKLQAYFEPADHHLSVLSDSGSLIQGSSAQESGLYSAGYVTSGDGFAFLILYDLWQREPRVAAALAGHEARLQAAHFEHFGTPGQAVLEARTYSMHSGGDPITAPQALKAITTELAPRACAALGRGVPSLTSGTASEQIAVLGFSLVDAAGQVLEPLAEGQLVDLRGPAGRAAGIRAAVAGGAKVGHVELGLTGVLGGVDLAQTVEEAPYALALSSALSVDEYYVSATAVAASDGGGAAAPGLSLRFPTIMGSAALHAAWTQTPRAVWADGTTLWAVDAAASTLVAYAVADGGSVGEAISLAAANSDPVGLWGNGTTLWVADRTAATLFAYAAADGSRLAGQDIVLAAGNSDAVGLWGNGTTLWVADRTAATLFAYAVADGSRLAGQDVALAADNRDPVGLWADGTRLWVADGATGTLVAYDVADWSRVVHQDVRTGMAGWETAPVLVWSDGTTIWVADPASGRLRALPLPPRPDDASLAALYLSDIPFGPFDPAVLDYTAYVPHSVATTTVTAWARVGTAYVAITPSDADATAPGRQVSLAAGAATAITVSVSDRATTRTTTVTVHRASATASTDATLSGLSLSGLDIGTFASGTLAYEAENVGALATTTVTATPTDSGARVAIEPADADPDAAGDQVALRGGTVTIAVKVTAADQATVQRYTVVVTTSTDATLSGLRLSGLDIGTFASGTLAYAAENVDGIALTTVTATRTDSGARVAIEPAVDADLDDTGHQVALEGGTVTIAVTVTAADRTTVRRYTVAVATSTDATLSRLSLSGMDIGTFTSEALTYATENADGIALTTVTATPRYHGAKVAIEPADAGPNKPGRQVALGAEPVTITVTVTAADRTTVRRYTVAVTPQTARLSALTLSGVALNFRPSVTTYGVSPPADITVMTVTARPAEDGASVAFDPATDVDTETPGHQVAVPADGLIITVTVTSADGAHQREYTVGLGDGHLRLVDGTSSWHGRVEVYLDGEWGTVCDDNFARVDAIVACRQLGYTGGLAANLGVRSGSGPIHLDDVACTGTEQRLIDCPYVGNHNCVHREDVGVYCDPPDNTARLSALTLSGIALDFLPGVTTYRVLLPSDASVTTVIATPAEYRASVTFDPATDADTATPDHQVTLPADGLTLTVTVTSADGAHRRDYTVQISPDHFDGNLRLAGGASPREGRVEVFLDSEWGTVCNDYFAEVDATVACRQLGYGGGELYTDAGPGSGSIHMDNVACAGTEQRLIDCPYHDAPNCFHHEDAGVACESDTARLSVLTLSGIALDFRPSVTTYYVFLPSDTSVTTVTATPAEDGADVAFDPATDADTATPGHQVTLPADGLTLTVTVTSADGAEQRDYTVQISPDHFDGNLRLAGGASPREGRVEVFLDGEWGTVCDDYFAEVDATVACRQLGYSAGETYEPGPGSGPIHLDNVGCAGTEQRLIDCPYHGRPNCSHSEDAGVACASP